MSAFSNFDNEFYNLSATKAVGNAPTDMGSEPAQTTQPQKQFGVFDYATDIALGVPRGILGGLSDIADLATLPFGYDTPDYFGLMGKSETVAGGITEGIANFMTGFIPGLGIAGRLGKIGKIAAIGRGIESAVVAAEAAGNVTKAVALKGVQAFAKGAVAGAVADFTVFGGHEQRLSNLLKDHAGFSNAVTDFLAADPNDNEVVGRFKNAIEGLAIGAAAEGLFNAFRVYKAGFLTKAAGGDADRAMAHEMAQIRVEQRDQLKQSFNLTDEQADLTNIMVDRMGLDRSKLGVVSGDQAKQAYDTAASGALEQRIPVAYSNYNAFTAFYERTGSSRFNLRDSLQASAEYNPEYKPLLDQMLNTFDSRSLDTVTVKFNEHSGRGGVYDTVNNLISLGYESDTRVLIHEAAHAVTVRKVDEVLIASGHYQRINSIHGVEHLDYMRVVAADNTVDENVRNLFTSYLKVFDDSAAVERIRELKLQAPSRALGLTLPKETAWARIPYGLGNIDEFIAEALSNPDFQTILQGIKAPEGNQTLFTSLLDAIKNILGISGEQPRTLFDTVISDVEKISSTPLSEFQVRGVQKLIASTPPMGSANAPKLLEQRAQWDTPEFKSWFARSGNFSKDINGNPKVFYHGTSGDFTQFRPSPRQGQAAAGNPEGPIMSFFTDSPNFAADYAGGYGGNIMPVYLRMENTFDFRNAEHLAMIERRTPRWMHEFIRKGDWQMLETPEVTQVIRDSGFDSMMIEESGHLNFAVFDGSQIKSATGNQGTFSSGSKDILKQGGGEVRGFAAFAEDGKAVIGGLANPDVGTAIHEISHVARRQLFDTTIPQSARMGISDADIRVVNEWAGAANGNWTVDAEEKFANGFMTYLKDGQAPQGLAGIFEKFADWMRNLYRDITGTGVNIEISPEVRDVFDKLVSRGPGYERAVDAATGVSQLVARSTPGLAEEAASVAPGAPKVLQQTTPGSPGLGKPGGTPNVPYNVERVTSVDELNRLAKDMVESEPLASTLDATAPESLAQAAKAGDEALSKYAALSGDGDTLDFQRLLSTEGGSVYDIQRARRELMGLTRFISTALDRVNTLATKGGLASPEEMYEFLVGRRNTEIAIQVAKERKREFARGLGQNRWAPAPEKHFSFIPPLPKAGEAAPSPAAVVPPPSAVATGPAAVTPGAAAGAPSPAVINPAMDAATKQRIIEAEIEKHGGRDAVLAEMKRVSEAAKEGPEVASKIIRAGRKGNMLTEFWINSILSGPVTSAVNFTGNLLTAIYLPLEKAVGAGLRGDLDTASKSLSQLKYMLYQAKDTMKLGAMAFREDRNFLESIGTAEADQMGRAWSAQARNLDPNSMAGQAMNFMGTIVNLPTRFLSATDEVFKQLNYRSAYMVELEAEGLKRFKGDHQAAAKWATETFNRTIENGQMYAEGVVLKKAYAEAEKAVKAGTLSQNEVDLFVGKYMADKDNWDPALGALSKMSLDKARYATFSTPLTDPNANSLAQVSAGIQKVVNKHPMLRFALPFIRTPTNILTFALDRTFPANLHNVRGAFGEYGKVLQAADAGVRAEAMGRLAFGSAAALTMATAAFNGTITGGGPKNKAEREAKMATGWLPYSIKVGNTYYSYRRIDPFASVLGIIADVVEGYQYGEQKHDHSLSQVVNTTVLALARNFTNKTYLTGVTNISNALSNPEQFGQNLVNQYVGSMVPYSSFMGQTMSTVTDDPMMKEVRTMADAVRAKIPGLADNLTPRRNVLGEAVIKTEGVGPDALSPVLYSTIKDDKILKEFDQLGHGFSPPKEMRGALNLTQFKTTNGQEAYDRWLELHGQVRIGGKTLREALLKEINSRSYQKLSPDTTMEYDSPRIRQLREIVSKYREAAYKQLLRESPELDRASRLDFANKQALRMGRSAQELFDLGNR